MTTLNFQSPSPSDSLTPLMRQYNAIKEKNPETVLLYRMGDFYEMFNEDAKIASKVLGLTLTSRNHGSAEESRRGIASRSSSRPRIRRTQRAS